MIDNEKHVENLIGKELLLGLKNNRKLVFLREVLVFNKENNRLNRKAAVDWKE